jgi:tripartite-type tricarboxylate transporter receptor subunit TctC
MNTLSRTCTLIALLLPLSQFIITPAQAQAYPNKPVRVMVTSSPGGATDIQARLYSAKLTQSLGQNFIVENRGGAGGRIAATFVAQQGSRDGYQVLAASPGFTIAPAVDDPPQLEPLRDFEPITLMSKAPYALVANPKFPVATFNEFLAYAKANPRKINFGISSPGSAINFAQVWLENAAGIEMTILAYKGTGPTTQDLLAGRLDLIFANVISAGPHIRAGRMRPLAVTTAERSSGLPDLPTFQEAGLKDFEVTTWHGWLTRKGTPLAAVNVLNAELNKVLKLPDVVKIISEDGGIPVGGNPDFFARHISSEIERWRRLAKIGGIQPNFD